MLVVKFLGRESLWTSLYYINVIFTLKRKIIDTIDGITVEQECFEKVCKKAKDKYDVKR